ncbi:hypothetical protein [Larkinella soli]|uniref:hypothetical protein n=1 Tax=Larkinella soli TaxID=1770527 RepID=UPI000FFBD65F|nr:hypothetical protein [Larkinella soli]
MAFKKGKPKTGGRKPGTPNKKTPLIKQRLVELTEEMFDTFRENMERLKPEDQVSAYLKVLEYVVAKQRETKIDVSTLSDEEVEELLNKALKKIEEP